MIERISPVLIEEVLRNAPRERDPRYFRTWQRVSLALQRALREWIPERCFEDLASFEDRETAYQVLVFAAARLCYGRPKTEFTFDVADRGTLDSALHNIGMTLRFVLEPVEQRLREAGLTELSPRYSPMWRHDILRIVRRRSRILIGLLASEARLIDAMIDLGTSGDVRRFARGASAALRNVLGQDMRDLIEGALRETIRVLIEQRAGEMEHLIDAGLDEHAGMCGAGSPDGGIGAQENCQNRDADGGGEMRDAGIVADVEPGARKPACQLIEVIVADSVLESIFGSGNPLDRKAKARGDGAEVLERPIFSRAS